MKSAGPASCVSCSGAPLLNVYAGPRVVDDAVREVVADELSVVADLHAVGAGHARDRSAPAEDVAVGDVRTLIDRDTQSGDAAVGGAPGRAALGHGNQRVAVRQVGLRPVRVDQVRAEARPRAGACWSRRTPRRLLHGRRRVVVTARFGRNRRAAAAHARRAQPLLVLIEAEFVARRRLPSPADVEALPRPVVARLRTAVRIRPLGSDRRH